MTKDWYRGISVRLAMTLGTWVQMWRMETAPEDVGMRMRAVDGKMEFVVRASV